jgi:hypothetical protein
VKVNSEELLGNTEYLTLYTRCRLKLYRYSGVNITLLPSSFLNEHFLKAEKSQQGVNITSAKNSYHEFPGQPDNETQCFFFIVPHQRKYLLEGIKGFIFCLLLQKSCICGRFRLHITLYKLLHFLPRVVSKTYLYLLVLLGANFDLRSCCHYTTPVTCLSCCPYGAHTKSNYRFLFSHAPLRCRCDSSEMREKASLIFLFGRKVLNFASIRIYRIFTIRSIRTP